MPRGTLKGGSRIPVELRRIFSPVAPEISDSRLRLFNQVTFAFWRKMALCAGGTVTRLCGIMNPLLPAGGCLRMNVATGTKTVCRRGLNSLTHAGKDHHSCRQSGKKQHPAPSFHSTGFKDVKIIKNKIRSTGIGVVWTSVINSRFIRVKLLFLKKAII